MEREYSIRNHLQARRVQERSNCGTLLGHLQRRCPGKWQSSTVTFTSKSLLSLWNSTRRHIYVEDPQLVKAQRSPAAGRLHPSRRGKSFSRQPTNPDGVGLFPHNHSELKMPGTAKTGLLVARKSSFSWA